MRFAYCALLLLPTFVMVEQANNRWKQDTKVNVYPRRKAQIGKQARGECARLKALTLTAAAAGGPSMPPQKYSGLH